jgi:N-ethylmaleimide reductase
MKKENKTDNYKLFTPVTIGRYTIKHRIVHAPVTRLRSNPDDSVSDIMVEYYSQRANDGGLLITESSHPFYDGRGYLGGPGIYEDAHIAGWKRLADAVHKKGGLIFMQLVHDGRQSHVDLTGGLPPAAPSVVPFEGLSLTQNGWVPVSMHRAIELEEIPTIIQGFRKGAERALQAGFDGVELHGANGYFVDTFLQDGTNKRTDQYGGSVENRARLPLEILEAIIGVWGADRVGMRLSPNGQWGEISDSDPETTFGYFAERLNAYGLAYLHIIEPRVKGTDTIAEGSDPVASRFLRRIFKGPIIVAGGFDRESAEAILQDGDADAVAFGRFYTSNPDLPERFRNGWPLEPYFRDAFWGGSEKWYTDWLPYDPGSQTGVTDMLTEKAGE